MCSIMFGVETVSARPVAPFNHRTSVMWTWLLPPLNRTAVMNCMQTSPDNARSARALPGCITAPNDAGYS